MRKAELRDVIEALQSARASSLAGDSKTAAEVLDSVLLWLLAEVRERSEVRHD